jgi:hypothetical protein
MMRGHSMTNPSATPGGFAPLTRYDGWARRAMQPATMLKIARAPYKDARDLPGYGDWQLLVSTFDAATRARVDDDVLRYHMVRGLVDEIIFAAGGIEREIEVLRTASQIAQAYVDTQIAGPIPQPEAGPVTLGHPAGHHAAYAATNALTWIRAVQERVRRKDPPSISPGFVRWFIRLVSRMRGGGASKRPEPAGLLASLKDGKLKTTIESHFAKLRPKLIDARKFDNYGLHAGAIPGGRKPPRFAIRQDGKVFFPFPDDPINNRIGTWEEFRYKDGRDALSYLEGLFDAVATFIDKMLDAYDAQPLTV